MSEFDKVQFREIDAAHEGQRIDNYLFSQLKGVPKSRVYRILRKGEVRVNKKRVKAEYKLQNGDSLRIPPIKVAEKTADENIHKFERVKELEAQILHETNQYILLNKPSGMAVHGGSGLSFGVIEALRALRPKEKFLELVHRLDRDTSGCLLIAKRRSYLTHFHELLRTKKMRKEYIAIVCGDWDNHQNRVTAPLKKNQPKSGERYVTVDNEGKASETGFKCLKRFGDYSLIKAMPMTGRTHQIRVHAQFAGCPLLGDDKYSETNEHRELLGSLKLKTFLLHAQKLSFTTPDSDKIVTFEAPLSQTFENTIEYLRQRK
ncbi:23S rRNA pseudouridine(955/2504/2580) synthase RluC [Aliikangiella coralliicola]|uniref:23S rRNA pseudouridine(955/2504/2580) synthase RluC n=1 Tax=Aliikangiella coralliicola TaxID=2592383 RepID=UPI001AEFC14B|nr:23S rRNA pseudouridine(955/2504/2580) synthase RluC [Aliikangiella coralliicola]